MSCAYRFGDRGRALPGGYTQVAIPVFMNKSNEVSIETFFTNSLRREFERSGVAKLSAKDDAPVVLEGEIMSVQFTPSAQVKNPALGFTLPLNAILNTEYRVVVVAKLKLRRKSDQRIMWEQSFNRERVYSAPQIGAEFINSANALYNQSSRLQTISTLADEIMEEAHDALTETF